MNEGPTGFAMDVAYWILPRFLHTTPDPVVLERLALPPWLNSIEWQSANQETRVP